MKLAKALDDKKMDTRMVDRLVSEGMITLADVDKFNSDLPDEEGNYDFVGSQEEVPAEETTEVTE